jgi:hypothetical protein
MTDSINENTVYSPSTIVDIVEIALTLLTVLLAVAYMLLILIRKTFRLNKRNWLNVNVCLSTVLLSLNLFLFTIIRIENISIMSCHLQDFLLAMAACQMMYAHCISSFNRLLAIRYFNKLLFRSSRWLLTSMAIGWIFGVLSAIPYLFYDGFACLSNEFPMFLKLYACFVTILIPIHIVTICNVSIFRYIHQVRRRVSDQNNNRNNHGLSCQRDAHVSKIMLLTFCLFVIGWIPIFFQQLFTTPERHLSQEILSFFQLLLSISLLGDMILIIYAKQDIRQFIKETFKCNGRILFIIKC